MILRPLSDEKWDFAETLLSVFKKISKYDEIFQKNGFQRKDILFFATMGDGDYMEEMLEAIPVKMFNAPETREAYGMKTQ